MSLFVTVIVVLGLCFAVLLVVLAVAGVAACLGGRFRKFFLRGLWFLLLPPAVVLWGMLGGRNIYQVKNVSITSDRLPESFDNYRIVQISDLHLDSFAHRLHSLKSLVKTVNSLNPDLIVFTRDFVTYSSSDLVEGYEVLGDMTAKDGKLSILGNHDYSTYVHFSKEKDRLESVEKVRSAERAIGFKLLEDENVFLCRGKDSLNVIGIGNISTIKRFHSFGNFEKAMDGSKGDYRILLSHDPSFWDAQVHKHPEIVLTLSGHTHSMQLSLFGWSPSKYIFKEYRGLYEYPANGADGVIDRNKQYLYVNIGLGETALPVRIGARPEVTLIELKR